MKIECLLTDVTAAGSPDRAERAIFGMILAGVVLSFRPYLWSGSHFDFGGDFGWALIWPI